MGASNSKQTVRVLVVDDDRKLCLLVSEYLSPMGFSVSLAHTGDDGLEKALSGDFDVVILDVMMPGMDGFEVLAQLRKKSDIPVLMLTSRGDETDRIVGLEIGADDYLPKTFSSRELLARLRAVVRRSMMEAKTKDEETDTLIERGALRLNPDSREVSLDGDLLEITAVEFDMLTTLIRSEGRVLSRDQLLDEIRGRDYEVFDRSIDMHISSLRKKLKDDPKNPKYIKTVRSVGYMFLEDRAGSK